MQKNALPRRAEPRLLRPFWFLFFCIIIFLLISPHSLEGPPLCGRYVFELLLDRIADFHEMLRPFPACDHAAWEVSWDSLFVFFFSRTVYSSLSLSLSLFLFSSDCPRTLLLVEFSLTTPFLLTKNTRPPISCKREREKERRTNRDDDDDDDGDDADGVQGS